MKKVRGRVGVLMGGASAEREVSLRSGEGVAAALESSGYDVVKVVLDAPERFAETIVRAKLDVAFLALHGRYGEDGCVQGLLELLRVPYTGSSVLASALAMDKLKAKELFRLHNVPTPPYFVANEATLADLAETHENFGFPVVVKPRREGSSVGLAVAKDFDGLERGIRAALEHDDSALVERFVKGMEVHVALLGGRVLGAIEVVPKSGLYDYASKYTPGATDYICPPRLATTRLRGVMNLAERAARSLGCTGACRVDLLVTEGENEYVLEVNTLPGMTPTSLLPKIAASAGIDYETLCETILDQATLYGPSEQKPVSTRRVATAESVASAKELVRRVG